MFKSSLKSVFTSFVITLISFNLGCKGISGSGVSETERFESGFRSLRIGQITTADNRVATTMAIDSRETIAVIEPAPGSPSLLEVLYQTSDNLTAQILVDSNSLPQQANTDDSKIVFSNFTDNGVTIEIQNAGINLPSQTVPLNNEIFGYFDLGKNLTHSKALTQDDLTRIFRIALIAVRVFGCTSQSFLQSTPSSSLPFGSLTDSACSSVLTTTLLNVIKVGDFEQRLIDGFVGDPIGCSYDSGSFAGVLDCLNNSKPEVIREALISVPDIEAVLDGTFNPETGEIIPPTPDPTPTPTSTPIPAPKPTATPDNSVPPLPQPPIPGAPEPA